MLKCLHGGQMRLDNVLYVPKVKSNILSLGQFDEHRCRILWWTASLPSMINKEDS